MDRRDTPCGHPWRSAPIFISVLSVRQDTTRRKLTALVLAVALLGTLVASPAAAAAQTDTSVDANGVSVPSPPDPADPTDPADPGGPGDPADPAGPADPPDIVG